MKRLFVTLLATSVLAACSSSDDDPAPSRAVTIPFAAEANGTPVDCGATLTHLGTTDASATLLDFRFYVHNVTLITAAGARYPVTLDDSDFQGDGVALLDFQDLDGSCAGAAKLTNSDVTGTVAAGSEVQFDRLEFTIGVPSSLNHENPSDLPGHLNVTDMHWTWQSGFKHMRLDINPAGDLSAWNFHLGSTGCTPDPESNAGAEVSCVRTNRPVITLEAFDPETDTVLVDYGVLVANSDVTVNAAGPAGCMSGQTDPECDELFAQLGMDISLTDTTEDYDVTQSVFSVQ